MDHQRRTIDPCGTSVSVCQLRVKVRYSDRSGETAAAERVGEDVEFGFRHQQLPRRSVSSTRLIIHARLAGREVSSIARCDTDCAADFSGARKRGVGDARLPI